MSENNLGRNKYRRAAALIFEALLTIGDLEGISEPAGDLDGG